ncbi:MAG: JAB domain-containing protein, partial [Methylobacter sp.]|nr:JAB domain-containing protein [Methylobacter sp.]
MLKQGHEALREEYKITDNQGTNEDNRTQDIAVKEHGVPDRAEGRGSEESRLNKELDALLLKREQMRERHMAKYRNGSATRAQTTTHNANVSHLNDQIIELRAEIKASVTQPTESAKNPKESSNSSISDQANQQYHQAIKSMSDELVEGGGVAYTYDDNGKINGRTQSVNPPWFKDGTFVVLSAKGEALEKSPSVKEIKAAVNAHEAGEKITDKQRRILSALSDMATAEEAFQNQGYDTEELDFANGIASLLLAAKQFDNEHYEGLNSLAEQGKVTQDNIHEFWGELNDYIEAETTRNSTDRGESSSQGNIGQEELQLTGQTEADEANQGEINEQETTYQISDEPGGAYDTGWRNSALQRPQVINVKTGTVKTGITEVNTPQDALHVISSFSDFAQEQMLAIVLDKNNKVLQVVRHTAGLSDSSMVDPGVLAGSIHGIKGARSVFFAHNHPSGKMSQSNADYEITDKLTELLRGTGVASKGMLVTVTGQQGTWYDSEIHTLDSPVIKETEAERTKNINVTERKITSNTKLASEKITGPDDAVRIANIVANGRAGVLLLDNQNQPVSFVEMSDDTMSALRTGKTGTGASLLLKEIHETNARAMMMVIPVAEQSLESYANTAKNLSAFANNTGLTRFLDAIVGRKSLMTEGLNISSKGAYYSKSQSSAANPHTEQSLLSAIRSALDGKFYSGWTDAAMATGKFKVISRDEALKISSGAGDAKGFYDPAAGGDTS